MRQLYELFTSGREQRVGSPGEKGEGKGMKQEQKFKGHSFVFIIAFDPSHTFARAWLVLTHHVTEYPQFNLGDIRGYHTNEGKICLFITSYHRTLKRKRPTQCSYTIFHAHCKIVEG